MYHMRYVNDSSSLITLASCLSELHTITVCPFPIENVVGGGANLGNGQNSLVHNSCTQQAIVIKLELSSKYIIQYTLFKH